MLTNFYFFKQNSTNLQITESDSSSSEWKSQMKVLEERMSSLTSPQRSLYISDFTQLIDGTASVVETMGPNKKIQVCGCPQVSQNLSSTKRDPSFFEHAEDADQRRQAKIRGRKPSESPPSTFKPLIPPVASSSHKPTKHQSWAIPS